MLTCLPRSLCTWDYRVPDASSGTAELNFNFLTEQGDIQLADQGYEVRKHGWTSGHWTLEVNGHTLADVQKISPLTRTFEVETGGQHLTVQAQSVFTRCFDILELDRVQGTIQPMHPFTRRAVIDCSSAVPELVQLFCFWLVVITWRRSQSNNNS